MRRSSMILNPTIESINAYRAKRNLEKLLQNFLEILETDAKSCFPADPPWQVSKLNKILVLWNRTER